MEMEANVNQNYQKIQENPQSLKNFLYSITKSINKKLEQLDPESDKPQLYPHIKILQKNFIFTVEQLLNLTKADLEKIEIPIGLILAIQNKKKRPLNQQSINNITNQLDIKEEKENEKMEQYGCKHEEIQGQTNLQEIGFNLFHKISQFLNIVDLTVLSYTNKNLYEQCQDESIWKFHFEKYLQNVSFFIELSKKNFSFKQKCFQISNYNKKQQKGVEYLQITKWLHKIPTKLGINLRRQMEIRGIFRKNGLNYFDAILKYKPEQWKQLKIPEEIITELIKEIKSSFLSLSQNKNKDEVEIIFFASQTMKEIQKNIIDHVKKSRVKFGDDFKSNSQALHEYLEKARPDGERWIFYIHKSNQGSGIQFSNGKHYFYFIYKDWEYRIWVPPMFNKILNQF